MPENHRVEEQVRREGLTVLLVNAEDNEDAIIESDSFDQKWNWVRVPNGWKPEDGVPNGEGAIDAVLVFSTKYEERAIRQLCESIRANSVFTQCPLLVGVTQYQMPLANHVKKMEKGGFVFTPVKEADLLDHLERARTSP